ncbi:TonB-dependent siderophore receptor [Piscinibacter gummiphilus]|uniref:TonB-dependent receptor n=1 Tax=Piscinibacter gummiphilus TaxID=946333 RepID=A0A1W6L3B6_9BURK|nr:TonB-dependent siderophore receptor [Piscinibacter gummiphilus]ARN18658.1 TonB-dependent receptor [Piscinibacter gummiphilus]ATU63289.1 TonB-dependent siderophore receptor [Piscinibacter gummiphilus]GLS95625.1 ferrisiderophore receptor [Piscinibacter gummiphilus]
MKHPVLPVFTLCALAAAVSGAWAQSATDTPAAEPQSTTLPAVKVRAAAEESATGPVKGFRAKNALSATKTDTPIAETPQSITVITRDQLVDQGVTSVQQALNYAAGVRGDAYGLDSRTDSGRVRGATPDEYLDGLRKSFNWYTSQFRADPYMLERIEVLRGPAAMLYGQGSTGGVINLVSKRPQAERVNEIGVQYGSYNRKQVQGDFTGAFTPDGDWLYRVIGVARDADTQVDHVEDDRLLLAPSLTWRPNAATSVTFLGLVQKDHTGSTSQFLPWSGILTPNPNGRLPTDRFIGEPDWDRYDTERASIGWNAEHRFSDAWTFRQNARYSQNKVDYRQHYANSFSSDPTFGDPADPTERIVQRYADAGITKVKMIQFDQNVEGRLATGSVDHTVLAGFDFTRGTTTGEAGALYPGTATNIDAYNPVYGNYVVPTLSPINKETIEQGGLYLQDQLKWGKLIGLVGLRYDTARNRTQNEATERDEALTKRLGVMYEVADGLRPFVSYSESFTPQANRDGVSFDPLRGKQWELGVKYEPANAGFALGATAYELNETNRVAGYTVADFRQLDDTKTKGFELEARGSVTKALDLVAFYNYTHVDDQIEGLPARQAGVWGTYRFAVAGITGLSAGAGLRYLSAFHDGVAPEVPAVTLLDAMVAWDSGNWRAALNITNVTDKIYVSTCLNRGDCWWGSRRNAIASVTYRF